MNKHGQLLRAASDINQTLFKHKHRKCLQVSTKTLETVVPNTHFSLDGRHLFS